MSDPDHFAGRPATFREVLANGEFRAIFYSSALSMLGDSMARVAVTALVFQRTQSVIAAAATFAISYLPWLGLGTVLAALAERYPYRRTMVVCDLARMVTIGLVAVPGMPLGVVLGLLFVTALFDPPFRAARSALTPRVVNGERYVLALSLFETTAQLALITGYFTGGAVAGYSSRMALLFDAATFGISACIVGLGVHHREPALRPERRSNLLRETAEGFTVVFGRRVLRSIAAVVFASLLFAIIPEGLAAAWAGHLTMNRDDRGWMQGLIMCSAPVGFIAGSLMINRLIGLPTRERLIRPFAVIAPLALVVALADPPVYGVALMTAASSFAVAALLPAANGLFVQVLPDEFRARAFGVMQTGVQLCQGAAVFAAGALANRFGLPLVVGLWGTAGVGLMLLSSLTWPGHDIVAEAVNQARATNRNTGQHEAVNQARPTNRNTGQHEAVNQARPTNKDAGQPEPARSVAAPPDGGAAGPPDDEAVRGAGDDWSPMPTASH
ncbi:MAG: transporter [Dactylosporangium sp.]|nr:transporter [Dactylosporangium sp.]